MSHSLDYRSNRAFLLLLASREYDPHPECLYHHDPIKPRGTSRLLVAHLLQFAGKKDPKSSSADDDIKLRLLPQLALLHLDELWSFSCPILQHRQHGIIQ